MWTAARLVVHNPEAAILTHCKPCFLPHLDEIGCFPSRPLLIDAFHLRESSTLYVASSLSVTRLWSSSRVRPRTLSSWHGEKRVGGSRPGPSQIPEGDYWEEDLRFRVTLGFIMQSGRLIKPWLLPEVSEIHICLTKWVESAEGEEQKSINNDSCRPLRELKRWIDKIPADVHTLVSHSQPAGCTGGNRDDDGSLTSVASIKSQFNHGNAAVLMLINKRSLGCGLH